MDKQLAQIERTVKDKQHERWLRYLAGSDADVKHILSKQFELDLKRKKEIFAKGGRTEMYKESKQEQEHEK